MLDVVFEYTPAGKVAEKIADTLDKIWYCWIKKYKTYDMCGTEYYILKCKICSKVKYEMCPFPPEHMNCKCIIKEGD